ncbi:hypothetical protein ACF3DV_24115 [Chlorogloeopsis fritschii PCC 9212]|uniref:Glycerophosphoryl diester phosphodiesterase membrane domain-containing protein n=1 Tax=Chlorogloeopsis fritschii PCC 6912 TaxID=211165 RepID=A0A433NPT2_CHLFR|nr:hypothetical protein [Chlorogloeopsis fritschii]RUR85850.1 hypothetical protein PCC6912_06750 [Chlorogloeopsis fritschii PCC 6912]
MPPNFTTQNLTQQLNIGNIVSLGSYLYRSRFKQYFQLALIAHLWLFVPIYGWAKFYATAGLISRLIFSDIIGQKESIRSAKFHVNKHFWQFLLTVILSILICLLQFLIFYILCSLASGIIYLILATIFGLISQPINQVNPFSNLLFTIIIIPTVIAVYLSPLWFYSRFFLTDLPLAIEDKINSIQAMKLSRQLTKGLTLRIIAIILIAFFITLPIQILLWLILSFGFSIILGRISDLLFTQSGNNNDFIISSIVLIALNLINGIILMPFWQSVKSVVYYDIICRREGYDLILRDRSIEQTS